jgi:hypothetical protein
MNAPSININNNTTPSKKQTVNQSTSTVDQVKTSTYSITEQVQATSEKSLFYQKQQKCMDSFLQEKDLALQPLDFLYHLDIIPTNITNDVQSECDDDLFNEELLSKGFDSLREN